MKIGQLFPELAPAPEPKSAAMMIILRDKVVATEKAKQLESEALALAESVTQVTNAQEQNLAVEAQSSLARYVRAVQTAENEAKKPLNELRGKIIQLGKDLIARADSAGNRLGKLVADFQRLEKDRAAATRRLLDAQEGELGRERDKKLSQAQSGEEQEAIRDEYREQIAAITPAPEPVRASGQVIREDWDITVQDVHMLYRCHPNTVKLTPLPGAIKELLDLGVAVKGVKAEKVTKATVRLGRERETIEV